MHIDFLVDVFRRNPSGLKRIVPPLGYEDFIVLLSRASLLVSDSGGVQEEAPTLGKPVLVLLENTERPEAIEAGVARLVGGQPARLAVMLEEAYQDSGWIRDVSTCANPFGQGDSGKQMAQIIACPLDELLVVPRPLAAALGRGGTR